MARKPRTKQVEAEENVLTEVEPVTETVEAVERPKEQSKVKIEGDTLGEVQVSIRKLFG